MASLQADGQKRFNSDGSRNWATPNELERLTERSGASEKALEGQLERLQEELKKAIPIHAEAGLVRFPYGDVAKQQYTELRASGPEDKLSVSLVTQQKGKSGSMFCSKVTGSATGSHRRN